MALLYLIPAVIILIFAIPIFVEVRVSFNLLFNCGAVGIFVFKIKVLTLSFSLHENNIDIKKDGKTQVKQIDFSSPEFEFGKEFLRQIKDKTKLKKLFVFYNIGLGDAKESALVCGWMNMILTMFFAFIKNEKPTASLQIFDTVSYNNFACVVSLRGEISISLIDVAYSFIYSLIIKKTKKAHNI